MTNELHIPDFDAESKEPKKEDKVFNLKDFMNEEAEINLTNFNLEKFVKEVEGIKKPSDFDTDRSGYSKALLTKLKEEQLIQNFGSEFDEVTDSKLIAMLNAPVEINMDKDVGELYYYHEGEKTYILPSDNDVELTKQCVSELLPDISVDVTQGGNIEKAREVEALVKVAILNNIFSQLFQDDIKKIISTFDVKKLKGTSGTFFHFK